MFQSDLHVENPFITRIRLFLLFSFVHLELLYKCLSKFMLFQCSVSCGTGERIRPYWCQLGDNQMVTSHDTCGRDLPHHKEPCRLEDCASWAVGDWSPVSITLFVLC